MAQWLLYALRDLTLKGTTISLRQLSLVYLILITNSIDQLVFMVDILCIYCAVETVEYYLDFMLPSAEFDFVT